MSFEEAQKHRLYERLLFGVDSKIQSNVILQNNLTEFDWVKRNKLYPIYWGRNIIGENALSEAEISFLHSKACRIAAIWNYSESSNSEQRGEICAKKAYEVATSLKIPKNTAIFLEIQDNACVTRDYLKGYAQELLALGYTPGFKANTDAKFDFDCEYSRGMQTDEDVFNKCLIWAVAPTLKEFDRITTTHLIKPDEWRPYAPSGITRNDIAVWQYGKDCHPINDDENNRTSFNINLVKDERTIIDRMF